MFGLTTRRRLRNEVDAHLRTIRRMIRAEAKTGIAQTARAEAEQILSDEIDAHIETIRARTTVEDALGKERRTTRLLAEQLLDATGHYPAAARAQLGLPPAGPWHRAVEGLNALVDAGECFHVEPGGHISNSSGDERIEWDRTTNRWRLAHGADAAPPITVDSVLRTTLQPGPDGSR